ncbi:MAG: cupin domain-containing protein [Spirochaetaceae bacterium]|jgi:mannose-6-phosphate isomerase-like protein (cupin superfamily)|nr:cupin domain-containing protein [Spirochaetaceae bacterium]
MVIREFDKLPHVLRPDGVEMTEFFTGAHAGVRMGYGVFPPGMAAPPATHREDEYAFVLSGTAKAKIGGRIFEAAAGSATFIPAGEEHLSFNDGAEECRVLWILVPVTGA